MLRYFIENKFFQPVNSICNRLNQIKYNISTSEFIFSIQEYDDCNELFEEILAIAVKNNDETLANSQYVFKQYLLMFYNLIKFYKLLKSREYKSSWDKLQDCIDDAHYIGRFTSDRLEIPSLLKLFRSYESLYPYKVFASSEYVIHKSHCSLCGKPMQSLQCPHIRGNLYWGNPAAEIVDEITEFRAIALVSHPENKRCVIELPDDGRSEAEKFKKLDLFLDLNVPPLQHFTIDSAIEIRTKPVKQVGRNSPCSCGSGIKFKKCCGKDLYYKHERNTVSLGEKIELIIM